MADGKLNIGAIHHIGIMVPDVEAAAKRYSEQLGIGPWSFRDILPGTPKRVRGKETSTMSARVALASVGPIVLELIQDLTGPFFHHGDGLDHLGIVVDDVENVADRMRGFGYEEILYHPGGPMYFDTWNSLGTLLEFMPAGRVPSPLREG